MTGRQQRILQYLRKRKAKNLPPPTIREIGEECGISSTSVVAYNVGALHQAGLVTWHRFVSRGIIVHQESERDDMNLNDLIRDNEELRRKLKVAQMQVVALRRQVAALRTV